MKKSLISLITFAVLVIVFYVVLSNSHMLAIFPCVGGDSSPCELIDVTRHAHINGAQLTTVGYIMAVLIVVGIPAGIAAIVKKKLDKKTPPPVL